MSTSGIVHLGANGELAFEKYVSWRCPSCRNRPLGNVTARQWCDWFEDHCWAHFEEGEPLIEKDGYTTDRCPHCHARVAMKLTRSEWLAWVEQCPEHDEVGGSFLSPWELDIW